MSECFIQINEVDKTSQNRDINIDENVLYLNYQFNQLKRDYNAIQSIIQGYYNLYLVIKDNINKLLIKLKWQ